MMMRIRLIQTRTALFSFFVTLVIWVVPMPWFVPWLLLLMVLLLAADDISHFVKAGK